MINFQELTSAVKEGKIIVVNLQSSRLWLCSAKDETQVVGLKKHLGVSESEGVNTWFDNDGRVNQHIPETSDSAWDLLDATEGEVTLILNGAKNVAPSMLFRDKTLAITLVKEKWASKMMQTLKSPLAVLKSNDPKQEIPSDLKAEVYVLNLASEISPALAKEFSIIKLSNESDIEIIRNQGQKILPHI